jgi:phospholipase/carboxylesterase
MLLMRKRIYLCGFSQGSIMAYSIGLTVPEKIKGIAVMSGRLLEEVKPLIASKEKIKNLNVFVSHGTNDNIIPVNEARASVAYLKTLGMSRLYLKNILKLIRLVPLCLQTCCYG